MKRLAIAGALLALTACGVGSDEAEGNAAAAGNSENTASAASGQAATGARSDMKIQAGEWETVVEISGLDSLPKEMREALSKITTKHCITQEEADKANASVFTGKTDKNCTGEGFEAANGRLSGKLTCEGGDTPGKTVIEMDGTYGTDSYMLTQKMTTDAGGSNQVMNSKISGRRIGACTGNEAS